MMYSKSTGPDNQPPHVAISNLKNGIIRLSSERRVAINEGNYEKAIRLGNSLESTYEVLVKCVAKYGDTK